MYKAWASQQHIFVVSEKIHANLFQKANCPACVEALFSTQSLFLKQEKGRKSPEKKSANGGSGRHIQILRKLYGQSIFERKQSKCHASNFSPALGGWGRWKGCVRVPTWREFCESASSDRGPNDCQGLLEIAVADCCKRLILHPGDMSIISWTSRFFN